MNIQILRISESDISSFKEVLHLFVRVFEIEDFDCPDDVYLKKILKNPDFFVFVAFQKDEVIGGLSGYRLHHYYTSAPLFYIYDLAVDAPFQRKGVGKQLLNEVVSYAKTNGFSQVYVQADKEDEHALDFYRQSPLKNEAEVFHFTLEI